MHKIRKVKFSYCQKNSFVNCEERNLGEIKKTSRKDPNLLHGTGSDLLIGERNV